MDATLTPGMSRRQSPNLHTNPTIATMTDHLQTFDSKAIDTNNLSSPTMLSPRAQQRNISVTVQPKKQKMNGSGSRNLQLNGSH